MNWIGKWWKRFKWWLKQTEWSPRAVPASIEVTPVVPIVGYELPPEAPAPASPVLEAALADGSEKPVSGGEVMGGTLSNQPSLPSDIEIQRAKAEELFRRWHG